MKIENLGFFQEINKSKLNSYTGILWEYHLKKINSLTISSSQIINTSFKILIYIASIFVIISLTSVTFLADGVKYSFDSTIRSLDRLKNKFNKKKELAKPKPRSYFNLKITTLAISLIALTAHLTRKY
jgi:hypothetical protein